MRERSRNSGLPPAVRRRQPPCYVLSAAPDNKRLNLPGPGPRQRRKCLSLLDETSRAAAGARSALQVSRSTLSGVCSRTWSALNAPSACWAQALFGLPHAALRARFGRRHAKSRAPPGTWLTSPHMKRTASEPPPPLATRDHHASLPSETARLTAVRPSRFSSIRARTSHRAREPYHHLAREHRVGPARKAYRLTRACRPLPYGPGRHSPRPSPCRLPESRNAPKCRYLSTGQCCANKAQPTELKRPYFDTGAVAPAG